MKSKIKRNNLLPILICGAAIVSLGSIAFSTWIISWDNSESSFSSVVTVDGYKHETIFCEGNYNVNTINFDGETGGEGITSKDENNISVTDPLLKSEVILPTSYFQEIENSNKTQEEKNNTEIGNIILSLNANDSSNKIDSNIVSNNSNFGRDQSWNYSYLSLSIISEHLVYGDFIDYKEVSGYKIATKNIKVSIEYGTFFDSLTPEKYYQLKIDEYKEELNSSKIDKNQYLKYLNLMTEELEAFQAALNNKKLNIEIKAEINGINKQ